MGEEERIDSSWNSNWLPQANTKGSIFARYCRVRQASESICGQGSWEQAAQEKEEEEKEEEGFARLSPRLPDSFSLRNKGTLVFIAQFQRPCSDA
jgi:hypothetical protein